MLPSHPACHIQTERSLVWIFTVLSRARRSSDCASTVRIPDTLFYQHGSLRLWFANDDSGAGNGEIMRRDKRDCTTDRIIEVLGAAAAPGAVCDGIRQLGLPLKGQQRRRRHGSGGDDEEGPLPEAPPHLPVAAYYVYRASTPHPSGANPSTNGNSSMSRAESPSRAALRRRTEYRDVSGEELDTLEVHYMNRSSLILFLEQSRAPRHNAILQRFPHGRNPKHTTAEVIWTPHQTLVTLRQNLSILTDASTPLFDRCCTNEAAAHLSREVKATPQIVQLLAGECGAIVNHIVGVESRQVLRMVLAFAFDEQRRPTLLHASEVQLTLLPMASTDAKAGLARNYTRNLMHIAPPNVNGLQSILAAGGGLTEEDARGAQKGRARAAKLKFTQRQTLVEAIEHVRTADRFEASYTSMGGDPGLRRDPRHRDVAADFESRLKQMLAPRMAIDCPVLRPDDPIDDYDAHHPDDAIAAYLHRKQGTGRGATVAVVSGARDELSSFLSRRSATPTASGHRSVTGKSAAVVVPHPHAKAGRYCGGGGGGFFVDHAQRGNRSSSTRPGSSQAGRVSSPVQSPSLVGESTMELLRSDRTSSDSDDDVHPTGDGRYAMANVDEATLAARIDVKRMFSRRPGPTAATSSTSLGAAMEHRRSCWRRLRRKLPPAFVAAFERVQQDFAAALEVLDDWIGAIDLTLSVVPRPASGVPDDDALPVDVPPSFATFVTERDAQPSLRAVLAALVTQADGPRAPFELGSTLALKTSPASMSEPVLQSFNALLRRGAGAQLNSAATGGALYDAESSTHGGEGRHDDERPLPGLPRHLSMQGWQATRARLTHTRANASTLRAAAVYFELVALAPVLQWVDASPMASPHSVSHLRSTRTVGAVPKDEAVLAAQEYVASLSGVVSNSLEWPPRWAVHCPLPSTDPSPLPPSSIVPSVVAAQVLLKSPGSASILSASSSGAPAVRPAPRVVRPASAKPTTATRDH